MRYRRKDCGMVDVDDVRARRHAWSNENSLFADVWYHFFFRRKVSDVSDAHYVIISRQRFEVEKGILFDISISLGITSVIKADERINATKDWKDCPLCERRVYRVFYPNDVDFFG